MKNLKFEIRNIKLDKRFVQFDISDFGFEILKNSGPSPTFIFSTLASAL